MRKRISGPITVELQRDWRPFATATDDLEMLGVVKRGGWNIGAFAREKSTGLYVCVNGGSIYDIDAEQAEKALAAARR